MYIASGARQQLIQQERSLFLEREWPKFKQRAEDLGFDLNHLIQESS